MKKSILYIFLAILLAAGVYFFTKEKSAETTQLSTKVSKSDFLVSISATGELKAKKSTKIRGPEGMRSADIYNATIKEMIPEGTTVKKGDFVASLDKSELASKITSIQTDIERELTKLEQIKIDTAIQMKGVRDQIADLLFNMAQERLEIERNRYEPQMVIEQSELKLKNSERSMAQLEGRVELLVIQSNAKVREIEANMKQFQSKLDQMMALSSQFNITAPEDGMLIYQNEWNGKKGPGSQISAWDPIVAELPDLTKMTSVAYVNEVDISKIKKGQVVEIKVDAFPEKSFSGQIISVANIGQQLRGQEAKVFEIIISVDQTDDVLRPAMTTTNKIIVYNYPQVTNIPLEAFYSDSIDYVIHKTTSGLVKQQIVSGPANEDNIIVLSGINDGDNILLNAPEDVDKLPFKLLEETFVSNAKSMLDDWKQQKEKYDTENLNKVKEETDQNKEMDQGGTFIIFN